MTDRKQLRDACGPVEHIAVVGPRRSGKTTIANMMAEHLAAIHKGLSVVILRDSGRDDEVVCPESSCCDKFRVRPWRHQERDGHRPAAYIYDGFVPRTSPPMLRVISCSEIN